MTIKEEYPKEIITYEKISENSEETNLYKTTFFNELDLNLSVNKELE